MIAKLEKLSTKNSTELIVYQIGELKNSVENMTVEVRNYKENSDKRLSDLEKFQVAQLAKNTAEPKLDLQKIILAAFSLISTIVAIALGIRMNQ